MTNNKIDRLDEAIAQERKLAEINRFLLNTKPMMGNEISACESCVKKHERLVELLEELKAFRENRWTDIYFKRGYSKAENDYHAQSEKDRQSSYDCGYETGYNKAIDNFANSVKEILKDNAIYNTDCINTLVENLKGCAEPSHKTMKIEIEIPKEFECDYNSDKFKDFFSRVLCDIEGGTLCGNYEKEIIEMLINAFDKSKSSLSANKEEKIQKPCAEECIAIINNTIDDFAARLCYKIKSEIDDCADELDWIDNIAKQLKAGKEV